MRSNTSWGSTPLHFHIDWLYINCVLHCIMLVHKPLYLRPQHLHNVHTHIHSALCMYILSWAQPLFTCPHTHTHTHTHVMQHTFKITTIAYMSTCTHSHTLNMHWYTCSKNYTCNGLIMMIKTHAFRYKVCPFVCVYHHYYYMCHMCHMCLCVCVRVLCTCHDMNMQ